MTVKETYVRSFLVPAASKTEALKKVDDDFIDSAYIYDKTTENRESMSYSCKTAGKGVSIPERLKENKEIIAL